LRPAQREHGMTGSLLQRELKAIHIGDARHTRSHQGFRFDPYYRQPMTQPEGSGRRPVEVRGLVKRYARWHEERQAAP